MIDTKELIKNARIIADSIHVHSSFQDWEAAEKDTLEQCADALEAADKRIAELEEQHGKQLTRNIMLTAPLPKEGVWKCSYPEIESNPMFMYGICSICGFEQSISNKLNYCPNCGARMKKK